MIKLNEAICPVSGKPLRSCKGFYRSPAFKNVRLWKVVASRTMTPEEYCAVLKAQDRGLPPPVFEGFISKAGKPFSAGLEVQPDQDRLRFRFNTNSSPTSWICPIAQKPIRETEKAWISPAFPNLSIWKHTMGRDLAGEDAVRILFGKQFGVPHAFELVSRKGKPFTGGLTVINDRLSLDFSAPCQIADFKTFRKGDEAVHLAVLRHWVYSKNIKFAAVQFSGSDDLALLCRPPLTKGIWREKAKAEEEFHNLEQTLSTKGFAQGPLTIVEPVIVSDFAF